MIIDLRPPATTVRSPHDFTDLVIETSHPTTESIDVHLRGSGLGQLLDAEHAAIDVAELAALISLDDRSLNQWERMLDYAEAHGWTDEQRSVVRVHIRRLKPASSTSGVRGADNDLAEFDHQHFRDTLGHFPSGIAVITAITGDGPVGFSCQSFSSLSLDPPMILIAPGKTSTTWPRIHATGSFCVNILGAGQATLARRFAVSGGDKFAGVTWIPGTSGVPRLDGAAAWIDADIADVSTGGDHFIVQGRVRDLRGDPSVAPLIFHRGRFTELTV